MSAEAKALLDDLEVRISDEGLRTRAGLGSSEPWRGGMGCMAVGQRLCEGLAVGGESLGRWV